ncbi:MAG: hypothetical protein K2K32_09725 [Muribaculaceae bacterium]|nr:hypothetical protein [Muribaculaceae bacterium]
MNTKNISLLGLGLFAAVALASCDNIEESLSTPITNPQLPVFESSSVVYTPESAISAANQVDGEVKVASCSAADLPEGYTLGGNFQLSETQDFASVIETPLINKDNNLYINIDDLSAQYFRNITKNPATAPLFGRTILTASNENEIVRIGSVDTFFGNQTYSFTPVAPDHLISTSYYLVMGSANNWDFANALEFEHSGKDPYDDPVFAVNVDAASDKGNSWIVLSKEDYTTAKSSGSLTGIDYLIPVYDKEENNLQTGELVYSSKISFTSAPEMIVPSFVTINMESLSYSIKAFASVIYMVGAPQGWKIDNDVLAFPETASGSKIYSGIVKVNAGDFNFRFYSELGNWDTNSIGATNDDGVNLDITFVNGVYEGDVFQGGVNCTSGKGNWVAADWAGGALEITVNLKTNKITIKEVSEESGIYLRGGWDPSWGALPAYQFLVANKVNTWEIADVTITAGTEFKVADANWGAVNLGAGSDPTVTAGVACPLTQGSNDNLKMGADFTGKAELTLNDGEYSLTLLSK